MKREQIEILVEEPSMDNFLRVILPKILPEGYKLNDNCFIRPHEGKHDLQKAIPIKARAYKHHHLPVKIIIICDQNSSDCIILKKRLVKSITDNCKLPHLVRIVCRELECWYLGDLNAVEDVYPQSKATRYINKAKFRNPDLLNGANEMENLCQDFTKGYASREIPKRMRLNKNNSPSYHHLMSGIPNLLS